MENKQTTHNILMVRPTAFGNKSEAVKSIRQKSKESLESIQGKVLQEFDELVRVLRQQDVNVLVAENATNPQSIFVNSWITFHPQGHVVLYPLLAETQRTQRQPDILKMIESNFSVIQYHHFEQYEASNRFLEGAESIVFDRFNKVAYACSSPRTDATLLDKLCKEIGYQPASFRATDEQGQEIQQTGTMMAIGTSFAVVCMDAVADGADKLLLKQFLRTTHKDIMEISHDQMAAFAANIVEVAAQNGDSYIVLSASAKKALSDVQLNKLASHGTLLVVDVPTIEMYSGRSVKNMMAEIFLA